METQLEEFLPDGFFLLLDRLHNKGVYFKMGLRKMVNRSTCRNLHQSVRLEVDGKLVEMPAVEGIVILNILRSDLLCIICLSHTGVFEIMEGADIRILSKHYAVFLSRI